MSETRDDLSVMPADVDDAPPPPAWVRKRAAAWLRCADCGSAEVSCLPAFSVGSGLAYRPFAEDIYCRRCGRIGLPA